MAMASLIIDTNATYSNQRGGIAAFRVQGQLIHSMGSMIPNNNTPPRFLQTYFYDPDEAANIWVENVATRSQTDFKMLKK